MTEPDTPTDEEYRTKLDEFAAERGLDPDRVERTSRDHYRTFRGTTEDGTPPEVLRRLAFRRLRWQPPVEENGRLLLEE